MNPLHIVTTRAGISIFIISLLIGCSNTVSTPVMEVSTAKPTAMTPAIQVATMQKTLPSTQLPSSILHPEKKTECFKMIESSEFIDFPKDKLITYISRTENIDALVYSFIDGIKQGSLQNHVRNIVLSPDQKAYAYQSDSNNEIQIYLSNGELIKKIDIPDKSLLLVKWLNKENLLLSHNIPMPGTYYYMYPKDIDILNIQSSKSITWAADYPEIDQKNPGLMWTGGYTTVYNPQLSRVIYPGGIEKDYYGEMGPGYILRDLTVNKTLFSVATLNYAYTPKWSPDGSKVLIPRTDKGFFYLVSQDGMDVVRVEDSDPHSNMFADIFTWSPDGHSIAVWIKDYESQDKYFAHLGVYDISTNTLSDFCISAGQDIDKMYPSSPPEWSPDGRYLAIEANWRNGEKKHEKFFDIIIVDLQNKVFYKIAQNEELLGWLVGQD